MPLNHGAIARRHIVGTVGIPCGEMLFGPVHIAASRVCEFAVAVADAWQGSGIGHALLQRLEQHAARVGIRRMCTDTLISNNAMIGLAARNGFVVGPSSVDATLARIEKTLVSPAAQLLAS